MSTQTSTVYKLYTRKILTLTELPAHKGFRWCSIQNSHGPIQAAANNMKMGTRSSCRNTAGSAHVCDKKNQRLHCTLPPPTQQPLYKLPSEQDGGTVVFELLETNKSHKQPLTCI